MITIEQFLRSKLPNVEFTEDNLAVIANSPADVGLEPFELTDAAYPSDMDSLFMQRRNYMESNLWYSALGMFSGGSVTEKIGDESYSRTGYTITEGDRDRFKAIGDSLREKAGFAPEGYSEDEGIHDGSIYVGLIE